MLFPLGGKPAIINNINLTAGDATDTFSWSAPNNNGLTITKYGYQTTTNNGSTWSAETETASTSAILSTQYSLSSFKIRVRAFNAAGWGEYSSISSSGTVAWTANNGTDTETDTVCGPLGCTETDTVCGPLGCSQTENCDNGSNECGTKTRTRTSSRTRTRTSSRTRTRTTLFYSRAGSTNSSTTYGEWGSWSSYTYSDWGPYSAYTYSDWSNYGACSGGTWNYVSPFDGPNSVVVGGVTYNSWLQGYNDGTSAGCAGCHINNWDLYRCSTTQTYKVVYVGCAYVEFC